MKTMKVVTLICCWYLCLNFSFGQVDKAKWINDGMVYHNSVINRLNSLHKIDICDCKEGEEVYYYYQFNSMPLLTVDTSFYPSHFISIIKANAGRRVNTATIYSNLNKKDTIPQSGWRNFFRVWIA
jgi:hypothetical protein